MADIRTNARAVLLTPENRILMMKLREPVTKGEFWITPGGSAEAGEDLLAALLRELMEETGRDDYRIGPLIWTRNMTYAWDNRTVSQREHYFLVETETFTPKMLGNPESGEAKALQGFRWWSIPEMLESDDTFGPAGLAPLLDNLVKTGPPLEPIELTSSAS